MTDAARRKNELIISALISNTSVKAASLACGVSEKQIYARFKDREFMSMYDAARRELLQHSTAYVQGMVCEAIETMHDVMNDREAAPQVRLNAAEAIVRTMLKLTEQTDILTQLAELTKAVFENE